MTSPPAEKAAALCGSLPQGWDKAALGEIIPLSYGKGLTANSRTAGGNVPVYGSSGIVGWHDVALTSGTTIIVGRKGAAGAVHLSSGRCFPIDTVYYSEPYGIEAGFYAHLLSYLNLGRLDQSTTVPSLSRENYDPIVVPVPPVNDQRRIVEKIDELFSLIEAGEQALARARKLLERYRQSVLNAAVTGELTKDWRERHKGEIESGEALLKRILKARRKAWEKAELAKMHARGKPPINDRWKQKYKDPQPPDTSALPDLPDGWAWASLEMLTDIVGGITVDAKRSGSDLREVPYLRVANVQRGRLDLSEVKTLMAPAAKIDALRLMPGDILLNEGGDRDKIGRGWVWEGEIETCIHQNHVFRARSYLAEIPSRYISYYANEMGRGYFLSQGKQTTNLASINLTKVSHLPIPLPSAAEAVEIVELVDETCSLVDYLVADSAVQAVGADRLRQSILAAAFSGKLVPQDPADEPASVLLERISEQRSSAVLKAGRRLPGRRGRPSKERETAVATTRKEVKPTHLRDILRAGDGTMEAGSLWKTSDLDIDDFYKQLRDELAAGHLREDREGDVSKIICL